MEFNVDMSELEKQRYKAIKNSNKYIELNILIGTDDEETYKDRTGKMPVITTIMNNCTSSDIGGMYMTLRNLVDHFEKEYPLECIVAKQSMKITDIGSREFNLDDDKEN